MLRGEFCERNATESRNKVYAHEVTIPPPGAWPNLWLDGLDPHLKILADRLSLIQEGKTPVEIMSSVSEPARRRLTRIGVETLAFAPIDRNTRFPSSIASLASPLREALHGGPVIDY